MGAIRVWDGQSPSITFDFGSVKNVATATAYFKYYPQAAVYIPDSVGLRVSNDGVNFSSIQTRTFTAQELAPAGGNDADGVYQLLAAPTTARYIELTLNNQTNNRWVALSEVSFTAAVPEPETYAMLLAGLGLMAGVARRKQK